jgi:hypothetical protein
MVRNASLAGGASRIRRPFRRWPLVSAANWSFVLRPNLGARRCHRLTPTSLDRRQDFKGLCVRHVNRRSAYILFGHRNIGPPILRADSTWPNTESHSVGGIDVICEAP